ncbi:MAG: hypothetical protein LUH22_12090 [Bacteroides sp.]|nr:hypothetical protein [Bacteroides sp.]
MKKKAIKIWCIVCLIIVFVVAAAMFMNGEDEVQFNTTAVTTGSLDISVMATGYIQPVEEIEVGTQVSGVIEKIYVDYNSQVKKVSCWLNLINLLCRKNSTRPMPN